MLIAISQPMSSEFKSLGFSLVELMIGVAVLAIIMSIAFPSFNAMLKNSQIRNAAESIQNGIQVARTEAVKRNVPVQFDLRGTNSAWTVCVQPSPAASCPATDNATTIQSRAIGEGTSTDIAITTTNATPFVFNSFGAMTSPVPSSTGLVAVTADLNTSVLSAAESRELRVNIGAGGNIRMCDPNIASGPRAC